MNEEDETVREGLFIVGPSTVIVQRFGIEFDPEGSEETPLENVRNHVREPVAMGVVSGTNFMDQKGFLSMAITLDMAAHIVCAITHAVKRKGLEAAFNQRVDQANAAVKNFDSKHGGMTQSCGYKRTTTPRIKCIRFAGHEGPHAGRRGDIFDS